MQVGFAVVIFGSFFPLCVAGLVTGLRHYRPQRAVTLRD